MEVLGIIRHWFIPHPHNNHKARALHHDALLAYVLVLAVLNLGLRIVHREFPDVLGYATDIRLTELLETTNRKRAEAGLSLLSLNETLSRAAAAKAQDMFTYNYWAHNSPQGKTPWDFITIHGYRYALAGENLAKNFNTSASVVDAWMASPTHRENILKPGYKDIGFAIVNGMLNGEETTLVVQMFGATNESSAIAQVQAAEPRVVEADTQEAVGVQEQESETVPVAGTAPVLADAQLRAASAVGIKPWFDIGTVSREIAFVFSGMLIGILSVDAYIISRKRIFRFAGHNILHILFLAAMLVASQFITRGRLL